MALVNVECTLGTEICLQIVLPDPLARLDPLSYYNYIRLLIYFK